MKKVACLALVGALGLFGCGGGGSDDDDDIVFYDASDNPGDPDADTSGACNPVSQTGCAPGEKCTLILDLPDSGAGHVGCIADGSQALGDTCTRAMNAGEADDCAAGGYCYNGTCRKLCDELIPDSCNGDDQCNNFVDSGGNPLPIDWCLFGCDPLLQDCSTENEACYISGDSGVCLGHDEVPPGDNCTFTNDCAEGSQCLGAAGEQATCRELCGAIDEIWDIDAEGVLQWPTCCGTNCGATKDCTNPTEMCWLIGDGAGGILNVGFCQTDTDSSNPDGDPPYTCDCNRNEADGWKCIETAP